MAGSHTIAAFTVKSADVQRLLCLVSAGDGGQLHGLKTEATPVGRRPLSVQEHCLGP